MYDPTASCGAPGHITDTDFKYNWKTEFEIEINQKDPKIIKLEKH